MWQSTFLYWKILFTEVERQTGDAVHSDINLINHFRDLQFASPKAEHFYSGTTNVHRINKKTVKNSLTFQYMKDWTINIQIFLWWTLGWQVSSHFKASSKEAASRDCIQKFPDWLPGVRTANSTAFCHQVQLYRYFVSQSSEFCCHNPLCCFSTSVIVYFVMTQSGNFKIHPRISMCNSSRNQIPQ
jgi:hypothetical protein